MALRNKHLQVESDMIAEEMYEIIIRMTLISEPGE
jgi:hypothetical protein